MDFKTDDFLHGAYAKYGSVDGDVFIYDGHGPRLFMRIASTSANCIADVSQGELELGLFEHGSVIFFLFRFGKGNWSDAPFNIHQNGADYRTIPKTSQALRIRYYESTTHTLCVERELLLPEEFSNALRAMVTKQLQTELTHDEFVKLMREAYQEYNEPWQMVAWAAVRCKAPQLNPHQKSV